MELEALPVTLTLHLQGEVLEKVHLRSFSLEVQSKGNRWGANGRVGEGSAMGQRTAQTAGEKGGG